MINDYPISSDFDNAISKIVDLLNSMNAEYALIGGIAVARYGIIRPTRDIDVLLYIEKIKVPDFLNKLKSEGYTFDEKIVLKELSNDYFSSIEYKKIPIDILLPSIPFFRKILRGSKKVEMFGRTVPVIDVNDLIILKSIAFREQDKIDIKGIVAVNSDKIDISYIHSQLKALYGPHSEKLGQIQRLLPDRFGN